MPVTEIERCYNPEGSFSIACNCSKCNKVNDEQKPTSLITKYTKLVNECESRANKLLSEKIESKKVVQYDNDDFINITIATNSYKIYKEILTDLKEKIKQGNKHD